MVPQSLADVRALFWWGKTGWWLSCRGWKKGIYLAWLVLYWGPMFGPAMITSARHSLHASRQPEAVEWLGLRCLLVTS